MGKVCCLQSKNVCHHNASQKVTTIYMNESLLDRQTDGQMTLINDPNVLLCFADDAKIK